MSIASSARVRRKSRINQQNAKAITWILLAVILAGGLSVVAYFIFRKEAWPAIGLSALASAVVVGGAWYLLNQLVALVGTGAVVSEKMSSTVKSSLSEGRFRALIQHSLDIITIIDAKGVIQYISPSSDRVLGYTPDSLSGQSIFELVHQEDHALFQNALTQRTTFFFSFRMQHNDGTWLYFESAGTNMLQDPQIRGIVLNSRDVSDRKREEEAKKQKEMAAFRMNIERENIEREKKIIEEGKKQLEEAYSIIEHKNHEIHDSITYAFRIQKAMLPDTHDIKRALPESFVFWRPKDIVSGDFFWFADTGDYVLLAAADCTGHGVPGAFMTMIGNTLLNQVVKQQGAVMPDDILNKLHNAVRRALRQDEKGSTSRDGMDISFLCIDRKSQKVHWAGANNPLVYIRDGQPEELKADKYSIGGLQTEDSRVFTLQTIEAKTGDFFYVYSDGFQDQFGGDKGRKYMTKRFKELLQRIHTEHVDKQPEILNKEITDWIGTKFEQIDDILVLGVKI
jgi:PAS domain S-box-containing protein